MTASDAKSPTRRKFLQGAGLTVGSVALGLGAAQAARSARTAPDPRARPAPDPARPNVLYITADDLGTRLGAYGHDLVSTPRIDAFATEAVLFRRAYAQVAICGASRTSILTGLRPETTGVWGNDDPWRSAAPGAVTLVRHFRDAGYRTYGVGKIEDPRNGELDDPWVERRVGRREEQPAETLDLLRGVAGGGPSPWFLAVGFHQPHCPWTPSTASLSAYDGVDVLSVAGPHRQTSAGFLGGCAPDLRAGVEALAPVTPITLTNEEVFAITEAYLASVTDIDVMLGAILDEAEHLGLLENTIVIFWSGDHGFQLGDNGWGKWTCYDAATRIPLIMQVPGSSMAGREAGGLVEAVDMYPTLVDLCGLPLPPQVLDGVSFAPLLAEPDRRWKLAAFSTYRPFRSVKTDRYNLIVDDRNDTAELYDLREDPGEQHDLATSRPEVTSRLRAMLDAGPDAAVPAT